MKRNGICKFVVILLLTSCGSKQDFKNESGSRYAVDINPPAIDRPRPRFSETKLNTTERKIIKEGNISFETTDLVKTKFLIIKTVRALNGYIAKDEQINHYDKIEHLLSIRVPADKFDLLLSKISESSNKLDSKNIHVDDVTSEYIDIEARLKTKKELEARYKDLLKRASKVEEILLIEREIGQLRAEIESIEGRLNYFKDKVSFSSLNVNYYQNTSYAFGFISKIGHGIKNGWENLLWFFIAIINVWPFVLITGLVLYYIVRQRKRRQIKNMNK